MEYLLYGALAIAATWVVRKLEKLEDIHEALIELNKKIDQANGVRDSETADLLSFVERGSRNKRRK